MSFREGTREGVEMRKREEMGARREGAQGWVEEFFDCLKSLIASHPAHPYLARTHTHVWALYTSHERVCPSGYTQMHAISNAHTHPRLNAHAFQTGLPPSAQYIQVNGRGLGQVEQQTVDLLDVESHVRLSLPAAQHQVVHFFGTGPRALQHPALGYTLDHLESKKKRSGVSKSRKEKIWEVTYCCQNLQLFNSNDKAICSENANVSKLFC